MISFLNYSALIIFQYHCLLLTSHPTLSISLELPLSRLLLETCDFLFECFTWAWSWLVGWQDAIFATLSFPIVHWFACSNCGLATADISPQLYLLDIFESAFRWSNFHLLLVSHIFGQSIISILIFLCFRLPLLARQGILLIEGGGFYPDISCILLSPLGVIPL